MTTKISIANIQDSTLAVLGANPKITQVQICDSSYNVLDDTAVDTAGGYIKITGSGFKTGATVTVNKALATSTTFVSSTELRAQIPAQAAGTYVLYVVNTDGSVAIKVNGITYSAFPGWVTDSTLPAGVVDVAISIQLNASTATTYTLQAGSTLPTGLTLSSTGLLSGTITAQNQTADTTYNFTVIATDAELQDSPRSLSITITVGDLNWTYVSALVSPTTYGLPFTDDFSTSNSNVIPMGNIKAQNFNPYTPGYYSIYFDGTGDYCTRTLSAATNWTNTTFTIEAWVFPESLSADMTVFSTDNGNTRGLMLGIKTDGSLTTDNQADGASIGTSSGTSKVLVNRWNHIALTRSGTTLTYFINGVLSGTSNPGTYYDQNTNAFKIGAEIGNGKNFKGYISNLRFVTGQTLYTATFTPSTSPLTSISGTVLLACQTNRFVDSPTTNLPLTRNGDVKISSFDPFTANPAYATYGSAYCDGTDDYLTFPQMIVSGDFTAEAWVYPTADDASGYSVLFSSTAANNQFLFDAGSGAVGVYLNATAVVTATGTSVILNAWNHLAWVKSGSTWKIYVNGTSVATGTYSTAFSLDTIGRFAFSGGYEVNGYISDVRIVNGTAVYSADFTPPTAPLTAVTNTQLLTCQTNYNANNNGFQDKSGNDLLITRSGNPTQGSMSPYGENWGYYFDGTSDYINVPANAEFLLGTNDFTMEFWTMQPTVQASKPLLTSHQGGGMCNLGTTATKAMQFSYNASGGSSSSYSSLNGTTVLQDRVWYHVAVVRNGSALTMYLNGAVEASVSIAGINIGSYAGNKPFYIGAGGDLSSWYTGYLSNFRYVRGTAVYTSAFTPSKTPLAPIPNTRILVCQGPVPEIDPTFVQSTITKNANALCMKNGPFGNSPPSPTKYFSSSFNGTADVLTVGSSTNLALGNGDWTVEAWIFPKSVAVAQNIILDWRGSNNTLPVLYLINAQLVWRANLSNIITSSINLVANTWQHIALVRSGATLTMYINGVSAGSATDTLTYSNDSLKIGKAWDANYWSGYLTDIRIVKGTAVYTGAFTPPTAPLTAVTNTQFLLTANSNTVSDASANNFTITPGTTTLKRLAFAPFTPTYGTVAAYTPTTFGGSISLDGTGDYLTVAGGNALALGTSDFTIQFWVYFNAAPTADTMLYEGRNGVNGIYPLIYWKLSTTQISYYVNSTDVIVGTVAAATLEGRWTHIAVSRSSGVTKMFINGVQVGSNYTDTNNYLNSGNYPVIGATWTGGSTLNGYMSDIHVVKGRALYTTGFVPQHTPVTVTPDTVLLINGAGGGVYDSKMLYNFESGNNGRVATGFTKYGNTSLAFDGTDFLAEPIDRMEFGFGTGNFTVEMWIRSTSTSSAIFFDTRRQTETKFCLGLTANSTVVVAYFGSTAIITTGGLISLNQWHHIAFVRNGSTCTLYVNGLVAGTATNATDLGATGSLSLGTAGDARGNNSYDFHGYIADVRVSRNVARYTAAFTPPASPLATK